MKKITIKNKSTGKKFTLVKTNKIKPRLKRSRIA